MRRIFGLVIAFVVLATTPGVASAEPVGRPARNQQAVDYVIARALAQRGVPFTYGGGDSNGPTRGVQRAAPAVTPGTAPGITGLDTAAGPLAVNPNGTVALPDPNTGIVGVDPNANVVGFDASGIVVYAFAGVGLKLPRSSGEQYKVGRKILPAQALPGDLIFYGPEGTQSVALFVGNNMMLEATDPAVTVSPVRFNNMAPYLSRIID
jgi:cell wall-associated NlpC family hydrolase